jgi:hemerythrin-like domain-containing protein
MPTRKNTRAKDAIALLKEDHEKVRGLLSKLEKASERSAGRREQLLKQIDHEVKIHSQIEEEIFYPAFRDAATKKDDRELFLEAQEEHHVVDLVMPEVEETEPSTEEFAAKAKVLKDLIEHHAEEEEKQMFPRARKLMDREQLRDLGEQMQARKKELGG